MTVFASTPGGEFLSRALDSSVMVEPGDIVAVVGNQIVVSRNGIVIATRSLVGPSVAVPMTVANAELLTNAVFFRSTPVSGILVTLNQVTKNLATGTITFKFSNGSNREFTDGAQAVSETAYLDTQSEVAEDLLISISMKNSPNETNLETMLGAKCSIDLTANDPVTLTLE